MRKNGVWACLSCVAVIGAAGCAEIAATSDAGGGPDGGPGFDSGRCAVGLERAACGDGCDNDRDGLTDCDDPDCRGMGSCPGDAGPACPSGAESSAARCGDGCDNDGDGLTDCDDPSCAGVGGCAGEDDAGLPPSDGGCAAGPENTPVACSDGCDNDGDPFIDCDDADCGGVGSCPSDAGPSCPPGAESTAARCGDVCDNDGDGLIDCADTDCAGVGACPAPCPAGAESTSARCGDVCDNDGDGLIDCADADCAGMGSCPECTPGAQRCASSSVLQVCDASGSWPAGATCPLGCNTIGGAHCNSCTPGARTCNSAGNVSVCGSDGMLGTETCTRGCEDGACLGPRTITIVNDLHNAVVGSNNWPLWNEIIRVRTGATEASVTGSSSGEQLGYMESIRPGGASCSGFLCTETFSTESRGTDYWVYLQNGWWEYFCGGGACSWVRHDTAVICCDCSSTCSKWATIRVTGHLGGDLVIRASDFLSTGNWCSSTFC